MEVFNNKKSDQNVTRATRSKYSAFANELQSQAVVPLGPNSMPPQSMSGGAPRHGSWAFSELPPSMPPPPPSRPKQASMLESFFGVRSQPVQQQPVQEQQAPRRRKTLVETTLQAAVERGAARLPVESSEGFRVHEHVILSHGGEHEEVVTLCSVEPFVVSPPCKFPHGEGAHVMSYFDEEASMAAERTRLTQTVAGAIPGHSDAHFGEHMKQVFDQRGLPVDQSEFEGLSIEELEEKVEANENLIRDLEQDVETMVGPALQQQRIAALEKQLDGLRPGVKVPIQAPLLEKVSKIVRDSHEIEHQREIAEMRQRDASDELFQYYDEHDPWEYLHARELALGRSVMPLDREYIMQGGDPTAQWEAMEFGKRVLHQVHYHGHLGKAEEHVDCLFVKEEGILHRRPDYPRPYRNQFWLNLDGHNRHDAEIHRAARNKMMEDLNYDASMDVHKPQQMRGNVASAARQDYFSHLEPSQRGQAVEELRRMKEDPDTQRALRHHMADGSEDAFPVDWLGMFKKGRHARRHPQPEQGFQLPTWMY
jgi:hypothetical protein